MNEMFCSKSRSGRRSGVACPWSSQFSNSDYSGRRNNRFRERKRSRTLDHAGQLQPPQRGCTNGVMHTVSLASMHGKARHQYSVRIILHFYTVGALPGPHQRSSLSTQLGPGRLSKSFTRTRGSKRDGGLSGTTHNLACI